MRLVALQAAVLIVAVLALELVWRLRASARGEPHDPALVRERLAVLESRATSLVPVPVDANKDLPAQYAAQAQLLHPYVGSIVAGKREQIDVESTRLDRPEFDSDYEILILGGSVAAMFGPYGTPRLLELLKADPLFAARRIYVYQYGVGGFKQPQMLNLAEFLFVLGFTPECVLLIDGFNDVALGNANSAAGSHPSFPAHDMWNRLAYVAAPDRESVGWAWLGLEKQREMVEWVARARRYGVEHSLVASDYVLGKVTELEREAQDAFARYSRVVEDRAVHGVLAGPPFPAGVDEAARLSVRAWEQSSRSLRAACEARGAAYLHVLQPTLHDTGSKPLTPREIREGGAPATWIDGVHAGYPRLREAGERLRAGGEDFVDASMLFRDVNQRIYFDNCHYLEPGSRLLAERIAAALLEIEHHRTARGPNR